MCNNMLQRCMRSIYAIQRAICHSITVSCTFAKLCACDVPFHVHVLPFSKLPPYSLEVQNPAQSRENLLHWLDNIMILPGIVPITMMAVYYNLWKNSGDTLSQYNSAPSDSQPMKKLVDASSNASGADTHNFGNTLSCLLHIHRSIQTWLTLPIWVLPWHFWLLR